MTTHSPNLILSVLFAALVFLFGSFKRAAITIVTLLLLITFAAPRLTAETGYYFVDSKQVTTKDGQRQYFIYAKTETFRIRETYAYWDFKYANRYSAVEEKQCYEITHIWWRGTTDWTYFWKSSWFENPIQLNKVDNKLCS